MRITLVVGVIVAAAVLTGPAWAAPPVAEEGEPNALAERVLILHQAVRDLAEPRPRLMGGLALGTGIPLAGAALGDALSSGAFSTLDGFLLGGSAVMIGGGIAALLIDDPYRAEQVGIACWFGGEGFVFASLAFLGYRDESGAPAGDGFTESLAIAGAGIAVSSLLFALEEHPARPLADLRRRLRTPSERAEMTAASLALAEAELRRVRRPMFRRTFTLPLVGAALVDVGLALGEDDERERTIDLIVAGSLGLFALLFALPDWDPHAHYSALLKRAGLDVSLTPTPSGVAIGVSGHY